MFLQKSPENHVVFIMLVPSSDISFVRWFRLLINIMQYAIRNITKIRCLLFRTSINIHANMYLNIGTQFILACNVNGVYIPGHSGMQFLSLYVLYDTYGIS